MQKRFSVWIGISSIHLIKLFSRLFVVVSFAYMPTPYFMLIITHTKHFDMISEIKYYVVWWWCCCCSCGWWWWWWCCGRCLLQLLYDDDLAKKKVYKLSMSFHNCCFSCCHCYYYYYVNNALAQAKYIHDMCEVNVFPWLWLANQIKTQTRPKSLQKSSRLSLHKLQ